MWITWPHQWPLNQHSLFKMKWEVRRSRSRERRWRRRGWRTSWYFASFTHTVYVCVCSLRLNGQLISKFPFDSAHLSWFTCLTKLCVLCNVTVLGSWDEKLHCIFNSSFPGLSLSLSLSLCLAFKPQVWSFYDNCHWATRVTHHELREIQGDF